MFGCLYMLTRSLWLAIGAHWAVDFFQGSFFGVKVAGTTVAHPLLHSTLAGPTLWVGDKFGGGLVSFAIFLPIMVGLLVLTWRRGCFRHRSLHFRRTQAPGTVHGRPSPTISASAGLKIRS